MIYNVFNEDLLTRCRESHFLKQHIELAPLLDIINEKEKYKVKEIRKYEKQE